MCRTSILFLVLTQSKSDKLFRTFNHDCPLKPSSTNFQVFIFSIKVIDTGDFNLEMHQLLGSLLCILSSTLNMSKNGTTI